MPTVWLAHDTHSTKEYLTLKITESDPHDPERVNRERILNRYLEKNPEHRGAPIVRTILDTFELPGEVGPRLCLVYEPERVLCSFFFFWSAGRIK